jgi:type I restriction enzyme, S subunit
MNNWKSYVLDQIADIRISNVDKKSKPNENFALLCNYMDVYSNDYITDDLAFMESTASTVERARFKVDRGDILITKDSETPYDIGIPSVVLDEIENLVCGYHLALIKPNKDISNPLFLSKYLAASRVSSYFSRVAAGSTRYGLSNGAIARTKIKLPSLKKQHKISTVLLTIDRTIAKTETLIEKYQQIKAGLMHDLFTRGIGADDKLRSRREEAPELYRESAIGWIPREWNCLKLKEIAQKITDGDHHTPMRSNEGVYLLSARNILNGKISLSDVDYVPEIEYERMIKRCHPEQGDILISCSGTVGRVAIVPKNLKCCLVRSAALVKLDKEEINGKYAEMVFHSSILQSQIKASQKQAAQPNLFQGQIETLLIPVPNLSEQKDMTICLNPLVQKLKTLESEVSKFLNLKSGLMHDLLTGKVSVDVDPAP